MQIGAFLLSGAIAGLIGLQEIFAIRGFYTYNIASGLGFDGIAISLIGKNSPVGVVFSSVLFAFLKQAGYGLQLSTKVPNSVTYAIQGLMILFIVVINEVMIRFVRALRKKEAAAMDLSSSATSSSRAWRSPPPSPSRRSAACSPSAPGW